MSTATVICLCLGSFAAGIASMRIAQIVAEARELEERWRSWDAYEAVKPRGE